MNIDEEPMFVVIFEVQPKKERWNDYLDLARYLKPKLEAIDGFIDNERFQSKRTKGRVLSLSTWRMKRPWCAGARRLSITACRRRGGSKFSTTITSASAR